VGVLTEVLSRLQPTTSLETGVAFGISTLTICAAMAAAPGDASGRRHYGIDPNQTSQFGGAGLAAVQRAGLEHLFRLLEGPSHLELPRLLAEGVTLDFALIDGHHGFDYALLDFFFVDKMLRPGGIVAFHDYSWDAIQRAVRFVRTHREYQFTGSFRGLIGEGSLPRRLARVARVAARGDGAAAVGQHWRLAWGTPSMAILTKRRDYEPDHTFYADF